MRPIPYSLIAPFLDLKVKYDLLLQVSNHMEESLALANLDLNQAMAIAGKLIVDACFWLSIS